MPRNDDETSTLWGDEYDAESDLSPTHDHQAVVTGTDWTVETLLSQMRRGNFDLSPKFQRRDAWDPLRKSRFIESLILQLPVPQIVLAEKKNAKGQYIVLDGKQRLLALRQFAAGSSMDPNDSDFRTLKLTGLDMRPDLTKKNLADLEDSAEFLDDLNSFLNQTVRTVVVRSWPNDDFLNLVFLRLNTGSVGLSPQELRQALAPGSFTDFVDEYASSSAPIQKALGLKSPDFRMRDVEVALRFFAFDFSLENYRGNLKKFLDETNVELNEGWDKHASRVRAAADSLDEAIDLTIAIFGEHAFRTWTGQGYNRSFNRAIFDVMTYFFKDAKIRALAKDKPAELKNAFQRLSENDTEFANSIRTTTKTLQATQTRLLQWGSTLEECIGTPIPSLDLIRSLRGI